MHTIQRHGGPQKAAAHLQRKMTSLQSQASSDPKSARLLQVAKKLYSELSEQAGAASQPAPHNEALARVLSDLGVQQ
jgi:hypothetical protein